MRALMGSETLQSGHLRRSIRRWLLAPLRLVGLRWRPRRTPIEPLYFTKLKNLGDEEWRAALAESPRKAAQWVYAAATWGDIDAQLYWAQMLLDGYGTARDPEAAFRWFEIAAGSKRADALNMLGRCHERGWGTLVNFAKAAACFREAADKSYDWAQFNLACLMLEGKGVARDPEGAFALFMRAVGQGHAKSLHMVGRCYEHGWGRPADLTIATRWYRRSAESGDFRGQYRYGQLLWECGLLDDALGWLRRAVDTAPAAFCAVFAEELLGHSEPRLRDIGARARARAGESKHSASARG